jgi:ATP-dependent protease ClpP protease subunit
MSAAPLLVACGQPGERYATPNTWFMIHQSWDSFIDKRIDEVKKDIEHHDKMGDRWYELMALHTSKPAEFWREYTEQVGDHFFDAEEAQRLGIIDHIWDEKYDGTN